MTQQARLHLTGLDPEPADLDLLIGAAQILQPARTRPPHPVTGPVHPPAGRPERAGHELLRGQPRPVQVPAGHLRPGQVQLTRHTGRHRAQRAVQHVGADVRQRAAQRGTATGRNRAGQRVNRAFGRAVQVIARGTRRGGQLLPQRLAQRLAARQQDPRAVPRAGQQASRQHLLQIRRGQVHHVDPVRGHVAGQRLRVQPDILTDHVQLMTISQQREALQRRVERKRRGQRGPQPPPARRRHKAVTLAEHQVSQGPVLNHHPLRPAARPRRVHHIRRVTHAQAAPPRAAQITTRPTRAPRQPSQPHPPPAPARPRPAQPPPAPSPQPPAARPPAAPPPGPPEDPDPPADTPRRP